MPLIAKHIFVSAHLFHQHFLLKNKKRKKENFELLVAFELWTSLCLTQSLVPSILLSPSPYLVHTFAVQGRDPPSSPFCFLLYTDHGSLTASTIAAKGVDLSSLKRSRSN